MPSDLTISKLKGTTTPTASTREQEIAASHRKAGAYAKAYPNIYGQSLPKIVEQVGLLDAANKMATNEFLWNPQYRSEQADTSIRNLAASIAGFPSDTIEMLYNIAEAVPKGVSNKPLPSLEDSILEAFTSRRLAEQFGGDPEHTSFLPAQLLAPGPGEAKAMFVGARGAARMAGDKISKLEEFFAKGGRETELDPKLFQETGWWKGRDGEYRVWLDDSKAVFKHEELLSGRPKFKEAMEANPDGFGGKFNTTLPEVMDHPELFEAYPELKRLPVTLYYEWSPSAGIQWASRHHRPGQIGDLKAVSIKDDTIISRLNVYRETLGNSPEETILHEVQHAVQMLEGFAKGGSTNVPTKELEELADFLDMRETLTLIDKGKESIDELVDALVFDLGWDEDKALRVAQSNDVMAYLGATADQDMFTMRGIQEANESLISANANDIAWLLNYAEPNGATTDQIDTLIELAGKSPHGMREVVLNAYKNLHGEAEARLTAYARSNKIDFRRANRPPDPMDAPGTTKDRPLTEQSKRTVPEQTIIAGP